MIPIQAAPTMHSRDYYIRLSGPDIDALQGEHLFTEITDNSSSLCNGYTEWSALHEGKVISIGWDWSLLSDGHLEAVNLDQIRTNVMLRSGSGYDLGVKATTAALSAWLRAVDWKTKVLECIHSGGFPLH